MRIAIIGIGNVGRTLGLRWAEKGHSIDFGVRHPHDAKYNDLIDEVAGSIGIRTIADAVADATVVVLASPWSTVPEVLAAAGDLTNKIVIDCNNPLNPDLKSLSIGHTISAGELVARWAPGANVVKCFNTIGAARMADPLIDGIPITMPYCGDNAAAKATVRSLVADLGFDPVDLGSLEMSRLLEPLAMTWIYLSIHRGWGNDFAIQLLRRSPTTG